jgi:Tfp pilus assembly PilM family ATPase
VNRFVRLPPVKDKEASALLKQEIHNKIPIPADELVVAHWIHPAKREAVLGRPAVACTARRNTVAQRMDLLESCGVKLSGLQSDSLALANFAAHEFTELWSEVDQADDLDLDAYEDAISKAVVLIDCGASATNILMVSGEAHWGWTIELGGDDFTTQLSMANKLIHSEAEKLKRNPAALPSPSHQYLPVETRLDELRSRLEMVVADGLKQDNPFKAVQSWCMGGASQTHQWIRRIMLSHGRSA